jgi:hypothetical protein
VSDPRGSRGTDPEILEARDLDAAEAGDLDAAEAGDLDAAEAGDLDAAGAPELDAAGAHGSDAANDAGTDAAEPGPWRRRWRRVEGWFAEDPPELDLSPRGQELRAAAFLCLAMTLVIVLTGSPSRMPALTPLVALIGLVVPGMARNRWFWLLLFCLFIVSPIARPWVQLDNHNWLQVYWLGAILVSRFAVNPDLTLRLSARMLVGFAFLFAVTWKLIAPEFTTGAFFDFTFSTDRRLGDVAATFGLQESGLTGSNTRLISGWRTPGTVPVAEVLEVSPAIARLTPWLAWGTVLLEGAVAVTFLAPLQQRWRWLRDAAVTLFVATTYPLAPVTGFGLLVLSMSVMVSELHPRVRTALYVAAFIFVSLTSERDILLEWLEPLFTT